MIDKFSWMTVYPEVVLLVMACVIALVDLYVTSPRRTMTYVLTLLTLAVVPLRRALIVKEHGVLPYPEGTACADVLLPAAPWGEKKPAMAPPVRWRTRPPRPSQPAQW